MRTDAEAGGAQWAENDDPRATELGVRLRHLHLDELPQFVQVVTGKLSLVGPRPERKVFYDAFESHIHGFGQRLLVRPGITGLAQVNGGYNLLPEEKAAYDVRYINECSASADAKILLKTVRVVCRCEGAR